MLEKVVGKCLCRGILRRQKIFKETSAMKCQKKSLQKMFAADTFTAKILKNLQPQNVRKSRWRICFPQAFSPPKIFEETSTRECQKKSLQNLSAAGNFAIKNILKNLQPQNVRKSLLKISEESPARKGQKKSLKNMFAAEIFAAKTF